MSLLVTTHLGLVYRVEELAAARFRVSCLTAHEDMRTGRRLDPGKNCPESIELEAITLRIGEPFLIATQTLLALEAPPEFRHKGLQGMRLKQVHRYRQALPEEIAEHLRADNAIVSIQPEVEAAPPAAEDIAWDMGRAES